nr:MAG TPA: MqsA [Caudoviricetes sp.]
MKIIVKPKAKVKDKRLICPFCGFIRYIKKDILNRGIVKGIGFIDTNESVYKCNTCGTQWTN